MPDRDYTFLELTVSLCATCLRKVEAKVVEQDGRVYLHKWCPEHRFQKVLISTDADYYKLCRRTLKPAQVPLRFNTPIRHGCPYDCGLCPDHEQHSCLAIVEVTDQCNLTCPVCYSESSPHRPTHRNLEHVEFMLDAVVRNEGEPDVVQISGGEPTIHPQFWQILDAAKRRPIKHLMLNTNGVRIAADPDFARRLAAYQPGFEVYLQFDSLRAEPLVRLRGEDLRDVRRRALDHLNAHNVSTTLVVTLQKGVNDDEVGAILDYAVGQRCVRGVTFQPVQSAGRLDAFDPATDRLTLAEVRQRILDQSPIFRPQDVVPVPCHPDCLAMAYAIKWGGKVVPITGEVDPSVFLQAEGSTIVYERNPKLRERLYTLFAGCGCDPAADRPVAGGGAGGGTSLKQLLCCLPTVPLPDAVGYENLFRVIVMQFLDPHNFDVRAVKKSCVHIVHPDGRIIPFDTFNLFYRDGRERLLDDLRAGRGVPDHAAESGRVQLSVAGRSGSLA
ncbi:MAG: radical protein [Phycisphaerales bacterium]|nr:radical protein [Phycisphaerales bacterium]